MYKYRGPFGNFMLISFQVYVKDIYNFIYSIYYNAKKKKKKNTRISHIILPVGLNKAKTLTTANIWNLSMFANKL